MRQAIAVLAAVLGPLGVPGRAADDPLLIYACGPDGLVTNEHAVWSRGDPAAARSDVWEVTSGTLLCRAGAGWTGVPDARRPGPASEGGTNSAVFRMTTRRSDFGDVTVSFRLRTNALGRTDATPERDWDGVHVWLRWQSPAHLYHASVSRRDGTVVIKKKLPGGPSNGGRYVKLTRQARLPAPLGAWREVAATVRNQADGSVRLELRIDGRLALTAVDRGDGGPPIRAPGRVGLRGDNADFEFQDFVVSPAEDLAPLRLGSAEKR